jgi:hypothetical protein
MKVEKLNEAAHLLGFRRRNAWLFYIILEC